MSDFYTEDFGKFGARERGMLREILQAWNEQGLPEDFSDDNVRPAFNMNSGFVFLVNEDCQTAMMNGDKLESFYSTPYDGHEGFWDELVEEYAGMHRDDQRYMREIANGRDLPDEAEAA